MPTNVNEFKRYVEFLSNKAQSGSATPSQFNLGLHRATMQKFEMDFQRFLQDGFVTDYLTVFMKKKVVLIDSFGNANLPADYQHSASIRYPYKSAYVPVTEESNIDWGQLQVSQLFKGTKRFPKCSYFGSQIRFLPKDLGIAHLDYFSTPVEAVWGYNVVSNAEVYDPATSTDCQWDSTYMNEIAAIYLTEIGINLKDGDIQQFAQMYKAEN